MEKTTTNISPDEKNVEINDVNIQKTNESLDTIAFYLLEAIKRKLDNQPQKKGA